jgi:hypothetical protein
MCAQKNFTKTYFEQDFPKLQKMMDRLGQPLSVILTLEEGLRVELREFELTPSRLILQVSSGSYSIPFHTIRSIQFVPQSKKHLLLSA